MESPLRTWINDFPLNVYSAGLVGAQCVHGIDRGDLFRIPSNLSLAIWTRSFKYCDDGKVNGTRPFPVDITVPFIALTKTFKLRQVRSATSSVRNNHWYVVLTLYKENIVAVFWVGELTDVIVRLS